MFPELKKKKSNVWTNCSAQNFDLINEKYFSYQLTWKCNLFIFFLNSGQEASARGGGFWRWHWRGFRHQCWHHRGRSLCLSFFLYRGVEGGAYQRANRLQAASQTGYTANLIWKFTVLTKCSISVLVFSECKVFYDMTGLNLSVQFQ